MRLLAIAAFVALLGLAEARAFVLQYDPNGTPTHWDLLTPEAHVPAGAAVRVSTNSVNPLTRAVRFFISSDAYSKTNTTAERNAVRAAFAQWQAVPGTHVRFEDACLVAPGIPLDETDDTNVVFWVNNGTLVPDDRIDIDGALGVTFMSSTAGILLGADIVMNGNYTWFTDFDFVPPPPPDGTRFRFVEEVVGHEIGHFIGIEHTPVGAATMFARGGSGVSPQAGLSAEEVAAVQFLYPQAGVLAGKGRIQGQATMNGAALFGAAVIAEDSAGNVAAGTVSRPDGSYLMPALPPGDYRVRLLPLDPAGLVSGPDIVYPDYADVQTGFLPTAELPVTVQAGDTRVLNAVVTAGNAPFHIQWLLKPSSSITVQSRTSAAVAVRAGQSNLYLGVYSSDLPTTGADLSITGDGLTVTSQAASSQFAGLRMAAVKVNVSSSATPGLRSFVVRRGGDIAIAVGFLEIQPVTPDFNFDGLDDRFQRRYFSPFTSADAAPGADPDGDGLDNRYEFLAGTNPIDAASIPRLAIDRITADPQGSSIAWRSVPGGRYQVLRRQGLGSGTSWQAIGGVVTGTDFTTPFRDASATNRFGFYRVQVLR